MVQQHKHKLLSRKKVVANILKIWDLASESDKYDWYAEAHEFAQALTRAADITLNQAIGVIVALSPMKYWELNKKIALEFILKQTPNIHTKIFVNKALAVLQTTSEDEILNILHGNKLQAFYLNIKYPDNSVNLTIDRHALSVALGHWIDTNEYKNMTIKQYQFFSECYRYAAIKLKITPLMIQSVTWLVWRRIKETYPVIQTRLF